MNIVQSLWHISCFYLSAMAHYCLFALVLLAALGPCQALARDKNAAEDQTSNTFRFEVQPREIAPGETAILRWAIKDATKVLIEEASKSRGDLRKIGNFAATGSLLVQPKEDTTYVLTCQGSTTYSCASATLRVRVKKH
jgi:hypothetical protein